MSCIRELQIKDASEMLDCLNDKDNVRFMMIKSKTFTIDDCYNFINNACKDSSSKHFAIVDEGDNWVGTISLKNIDYNNKKAEYAIISSSKVHGKGYASKATDELVNYAFNELGLHKIFLNVRPDNIRAVEFYKKKGFEYVGRSVDSLYQNESYFDLLWFELINNN